MEEQNNKPYKAHVLVLPYTRQSHINPMLQFSKRLVSKNIKVTLANALSVSETSIMDPNIPVRFETISDGFDEPGSRDLVSRNDYIAKFGDVGPQSLSGLIQKLSHSGHPVDAVIYDSFIPWALDVVKDFGLMGAVFFTHSCTVSALFFYAYSGGLKLPLPDSPVLIPGLPLLQPWETPSYVYKHKVYPGGYEFMANQFSNIDKVDWVLFNVFDESEKEVVDTLKKLWKVKTIGPTIPSMYMDKRLEDDKGYGFNLYDPNSEFCLSWLNTKPSRSVIYISYGSIAEVQAEQIEEIALCLKEMEYNFLWVVRHSEESKLPSFVNEMTEKGMVVRWCPQLEVLSSDSIGCFVTHCGFNSVLEALSLGVAIVAMPLWTDQPTNAKYIEDIWGIGVRTKRDDRGIVRREMLGGSIRKVMVGERRNEIDKNLVKWKGLARDAVAEGGSSDRNINEFVSALARS